MILDNQSKPARAPFSQVFKALSTLGGPDEASSAVSTCLAGANTYEYHLQLITIGAPSNTYAAASGALLQGNGIDAETGPFMRSSMFGDACPWISVWGYFIDSNVPEFNETECLTYDNGIVTYGLLGVHAKIVRMGRDFCLTRGVATVGPDGIGTIPDPAGQMIRYPTRLPMS